MDSLWILVTGFALFILLGGTFVALFARKWRIAAILGALPAATILIAVFSIVAFYLACRFGQCAI